MGKFHDKNQKQQLESALRGERYRKHADRNSRVILLPDKGWTYDKITEDLLLDDGTIANVGNGHYHS